MRKLLTVVSLIAFLSLPSFGAGICSRFFGDSSGVQDTESVIQNYQRVINLLLQKKPFLWSPQLTEQTWTSRVGSCIPLSRQMQRALKMKNLDVIRIKVESRFSPVHYFLVDKSTPKEIIIDPTYKQFFDEDIPEASVFIGTRRQLENLFMRHQDHIHSLSPSVNQMDLDPISIVEAIYGYGRLKLSEDGVFVRTKIPLGQN